MSDRNDSIAGLQRAARLSHARDEAHFQLLRAGEALHRRRPLLRRIGFGTVAATALLVVVVTATAVASRGGDGDGRDGVRTAPPLAGGTQADETLTGTGGADRLDGRGGDDVIMAGGGKDVVFGSRGNDVLHGGAGDDVLWAGPGRDVLLGAEGDDQLRASNVDGQVDRLHCGPGNDTAWVVSVNGRQEDKTFGCERVIVVEVRRVRARR